MITKCFECGKNCLYEDSIKVSFKRSWLSHDGLERPTIIEANFCSDECRKKYNELMNIYNGMINFEVKEKEIEE